MNRPRCRDWLPLATQQMRLRNLIRVSGINIECSMERALIYFTLHSTGQAAHFYASEPLPQPYFQLRWAEINCAELLKSNANCVCVKVWARQREPTGAAKQQGTTQTDSMPTSSREPISALCMELSKACLSPHDSPRPPDKLLFSWAVYFSGLMLLGQPESGADVKCQPNSLIFQINGDYFASPAHFAGDGLREQFTLNYKRYAPHMPQHQNDDVNDGSFAINSPRVSRSSSPVPFNLERDLLSMSVTRYAQLNCERKEVRKSYSLQQLLKLQQLQRRHLQRVRECDELAADIKQLSVRCITKEQLLLRHRRRRNISALQQQEHSHHHNQHHQQYHSMGRTLSVLLAEQQQIEPDQLLRAQGLQQQREQLRCRQRLLLAERNTYVGRIMELRRQQLDTLSEARATLSATLQTRQAALRAEQCEWRVEQAAAISQLAAKRQLVADMERRIATLCMELREIYPLGSDRCGYQTICGIPFPSDVYASDGGATATGGVEQVSPMALSAALGYVAHLVQMFALILHRPLRNPILHEGSHSRILDIIKELPHISREFPLYTRSSILPKSVLYAIYLLNQNIAQLCYDITGRRTDWRSTINNLGRIYAKLAEIGQPKAAVERVNLCAVDGALGMSALDGHQAADTCLSNSNSSDMNNHMLLPPTALTLTLSSSPKTQNDSKLFERLPSHNGAARRRFISERGIVMHERICRSVGSYSDCDEDAVDVVDSFKDERRHYSNSDSEIALKRGGHV